MDRGAGGKEGGAMNYGWLKTPPWWKKSGATLITPDGNVVSQVYWRNGALVDAQSVGWAMQGTVPQIGASGVFPPGAGPCSNVNYYKLGTGNDVLDFAGNFFAAIVLGSNPPNGNLPYSNGGYQVSGLYLTIYNPGSFYLSVNSAGAQGNAIASGTWYSGTANLLCFGCSGGIYYAALNAGSVGSSAAAYVNGTTQQCYLGSNAANPGVNCLYEAYWTSTAWSTGLANGTAASVRAKLKTPW